MPPRNPSKPKRMDPGTEAIPPAGRKLSLGAGLLGFLLMIWIFGTTGAAWPRDYYVATRGHDDAPGTVKQPFQTLGRACRAVRPGDTVFARGGIYRERLEPKVSGEAGAYITFRSFPGETATLDAAGLRQGVILWGVSYIRVIAFEIKNARHSGIHIHHHLDAEDRGADYHIIAQNTIHDCGRLGYSGIFVGGNCNHILENRILANGGEGAPEPDHGVYVSGDRNRIERNRIEANARHGIRLQGNSNRIEANTISANGEAGIGIWVDAPLQCSGTLVRGNILALNRLGGITLNGAGSGGRIEKTRIYNNTIVQATGRYGLRLINGIGPTTVMNTIIVGRYLQGLVYTDRSSSGDFVSDYNLYHGSSRFYFGGRFYDSFKRYRQAAGCEAHSRLEAPRLGADFLPAEGSPAVDSGIDLGYAFRGTAPDRGARER